MYSIEEHRSNGAHPNVLAAGGTTVEDRPAEGEVPRRQTPGHGGIQRVGVVGSGTMGAAVAELCATRGLDVRLAVSGPAAARTAPQRIAASTHRKVQRRQLTATDRDATLERIAVTTDLATLHDRQLVIEAVPERIDLKHAVFRSLDAATGPGTILASTTSALSITRLAAATDRADRVVGVHFFNPVAALPLVEVVLTLQTDEQVGRQVTAFVTGALDKQAITVADRSGFVVNALLVPYLLSAVRMVESGMCPAEQVDQAMELGCAHPMGPLRLVDLIGLDVVVAIAESMYEEFKQPLYAPPPLLLRMVDAGLLGRKAGRGFHTYPNPGAPAHRV